MESIEETQKMSFSSLYIMWKNSVRTFQLLWREKKGQVILYTFLLVIVGVLPFLRSGVMGLFINELTSQNFQETSFEFIALVSAFIFITSASPFLWTWERYVEKMFWFFLANKIEILPLQKKKDLGIATLEDPKKNDIINRVNENSWRLQNFADRIFFILQNIFGVLVASIIIWNIKWWILILIVLGTIPELIVQFRAGKSVWGIHGARAEIRRRYWDAGSHFSSLYLLTELKLFQNTEYFISIISNLFETFQKEERANEKKRMLLTLGALVISQGALAASFIVLISDVVHGALLVGTLTFLIASIIEFRQTLSSFFEQVGRQYEDNLFVNDLFDFLDWKPVIVNTSNCKKLPKDKTPKIEFKNVSFVYPGTTKMSLKNISFTLNPGEKLALVGQNGAGKTTLIKLLCRFYDPTEGEILVDGTNLKNIDIDDWHHILGVLFQEYGQYNFVVKESIGMGRTDTPFSLERVKSAAESSESESFIKEWKGGYEQMLGKEFTDGIEPSIGQWQKLALARTFYRNPKLYVFDEPTASIDAEAEAKIFEKLESLPKDRSVIIISHRFSTVRQAQVIVVLKDGQIEEQGTHSELLEKDALYARLFKLQAKGYK